MATKQLEGRIEALENRMRAIERQIIDAVPGASSHERAGWLDFVGIFADSPDFEEAVQLGQEWRYKDRPEELHNGTD
jgi:hypothetical protein